MSWCFSFSVFVYLTVPRPLQTTVLLARCWLEHGTYVRTSPSVYAGVYVGVYVGVYACVGVDGVYVGVYVVCGKHYRTFT